uniref:Cilia and flagella associated protein 161 n=2 Tax=Lepisosteus oculatus TaxID=7918 RepID=W5N582_LEPOC
AMSVRTYSARVRVGNWSEDVTLEEDTLKDFLDKKEKGELIVQRTGFLRQNILKKIDLSVTNDGLVHFGDVIMLVNPDSASLDSPCEPAALGMNTDASELRGASFVCAPCEVSASRSLTPCVRNAFVITSVDGSPVGEPLRYNQSFSLQTTKGFAGELYLASDHKTFQKCAKKSRLQEVILTDEPSFLTWWQAVYYDPQERIEYEGFPVPANSKVLISHCKTNQCLAALRNYIIWTPYGKEYEVTAQTFLDSHKAEREVNHWSFVTANPSNEGQTIPDRPGAMANMTPTENTEPQHKT